MNQESDELRRRLLETFRGGGYSGLRMMFAERDPTEIYHSLFPIAVEYRGDAADALAVRLLADFEPLCPVSCRDALLTVAFGDPQLSERLIPYYLVTQFGKRKLLKTINELRSEVGLSGSQIAALSGIAYWIQRPTAELLQPLFSWRQNLPET